MRPTNFKQETMELIGDHKVDEYMLINDNDMSFCDDYNAYLCDA